MLDCAVLLGVLICASPLSAQSVQQSGVVTPTHFACWTTGGVIQDCGVAAQPFASTGGVSPGPFCVNSGPVTGPYQSFCLNTNVSTGGILSIQNFGGSAPGGISFNINGTPASFPTVVTPTVATHGACFNNTTGTLIDCGYVPIGSANALDVFLVIGDSQAVGQGSSASSPPVQTGALMYCANGTIVAANDPTCSAVNATQNASTGSMWPATSLAFGRNIGFVLTGVSGSTQATACDIGVGNGNWQSTAGGSNYANALAALNAALTAYTAAGYVTTFRGIIYVLGNNDALQIDNSACTAVQYTAGLTAMVANWRTATIGGTTYPHLKFWMPIIGTNTTAAISDSGYSQVRAAQLTFAAGDGNFSVPFTDLYSMAARGYIQTNSVHLNQSGLNIMGAAVGATLVPSVAANIPYQLFSQNAGIGGTAPAGTILQLSGADTVQTFSLVDAYANSPVLQLRRADTTLQAPSAVQNGETIGNFSVQSFGATTFGSTAQGALLFSATQNHTDAAKGTQACIYTTANGSASPTCNLTVGQSGLISVGALTLTGTLTTAVTGSTQCLHVNSSGVVSGAGSDCSTSGITIGTTTITSGTNGRILYDNSAVVGEATVTGSLGNVVLSTSPTISGLTVTGSFTATGLVTNADLANASVTYGTTTVALGASSTSIAGLTELSLTSASGATVDWNADTYFGRSAAAALRLGQADAAAAVAQKLGVQNVVTGTSNTAGADWTIAASQGTGTGIGGNIKFQVAPAGLTGTSVNALTDVLQIYNTQRVNVSATNSAPDALLTVNANTGTTSVVSQGHILHLVAADASLLPVEFDTFGSANAAFGLFLGRGSGGTRSSPTAMPAAAYIFNIQGQGYDGVSAMNGVADIGIKTLNQTSTSDASGQIIFRTNASGSTGNLTQRILIRSGVIIGTGTTDPGAGNLTTNGTVLLTGLPTSNPGGTVSALCWGATAGSVWTDTSGTICGISALMYKTLLPPSENIDPVVALRRIVALRTEPWKYKPEFQDHGRTVHVGLIADDVATMDMRCANHDNPDDPAQITNFSDRCWEVYATAAIKALKADNDNLRHELTALKRKIK